MIDPDRHSHALEAEIITDPVEKAKREAANALRQYDAVREQVEFWLHPERPFRLRPSAILNLHRYALDGLSSYAGVFRPSGIEIKGSKHAPPGAHLVPELVEDLCDYVTRFWQDRSPIHMAAYVLWRLNWIHPFTDGNGRTSRVVSFLVLCVRLGTILPGTKTIPEFIVENKTPYYKALEVADNGLEEKGEPDLSAMEEYLGALLAKQLAAVHEKAKSI